MTTITLSGTVKFFDNKKGFGYITTDKGDFYINSAIAGGHASELIKGARVSIACISRYQAGKYTLELDSLFSVKTSEMVLDTVRFFDENKGYGFVNCSGAGLSKDQAFLHMSVAKQSGIIPGEGMPVRAVIVESERGPKVTSFEWGEEVEAAWKMQMAMLHADDGAKQITAEMPEVSAPSAEPEPVATPTPRMRASQPRSRKAKPAPTTPPATTPDVAPANVAQMVLASARSLNGTGGAMAEALSAAFAGNA